MEIESLKFTVSAEAIIVNKYVKTKKLMFTFIELKRMDILELQNQLIIYKKHIL